MKTLLVFNPKSLEFRKYFDLLDDEILGHLNSNLELEMRETVHSPR